jgi:wyosine [tRNA(Phe)-imidazoG37] synthetase (radical SAM superfamily)
MSIPISAIEIPSLAHRSALSLRPTAFGCPRDFLGNRFVYAVISPRARGLSIGVNMNPDRQCNFDCPYCEVNRCAPVVDTHLDVDVMAMELHKTLALVRSGELRQMSFFSTVPSELLKLQHVSLSGDGEPTLCPNFEEAVQSVVHVRARGPFFKLVLITNGTALDAEEVQNGLKYFTSNDEVWAKLDAGTAAYMDKINKPQVPLSKVLENILATGRKRPVIIQSLFPSINGEEPTAEEIVEYVHRLNELKQRGAQISLVQIYSATRPTPRSQCGHLPLKTLSRIAHAVRTTTGLNAEVF